MRIAFLEDDTTQAEVIKSWLEAEDHAYRHYVDARTFINELRRESFDLMILDWELPESSGIEVLHWVREHVDWPIPILFVTNRDSERDMVYALEQGADDYMTKPVSRQVTLARINALARRKESATRGDTTLDFGCYQISLQHGRIARSGEPIELTEKEYRLALMLFNNIGRLISRDHMLKNVWGIQSTLATRTVDTHISRIRRKLDLTPENGWRLKAVYQHGYRLEKISD